MAAPIVGLFFAELRRRVSVDWPEDYAQNDGTARLNGRLMEAYTGLVDGKMRRRRTRKRGIGGSLSSNGAPQGMKGACVGTP